MWWRPTRPQVAYDRVEVRNASDGGVVYWLLKFYVFGLLALLGLCGLGGAATYVYFAATLPALPDLARYRLEAAETTTVRAWDGTLLGSFAKEYRDIQPFEAFPETLVKAVVAIEDRRFYEHSGLDYRGIARAALANLRAGKVAQGGSTITQQVAKSFLGALAAERSLLRKIPEAILSRRIEARYTKQEILTLYLNQIFLGHGAYGMAAAARRFFDKSLAQLDVGEMATLAGIARAPSRFSPLAFPERARARRDQVLAAMVEAGAISEPEATTFRARPLEVRPPREIFGERSPHFAEHIRRDIARRYGEDKLWKGGLEVETTLVPWIDANAQDSVDFSLRKLDKRQGFRGPVARLVGAAADDFRARAVARHGADPPREGRLYLGLVETVAADGSARVRVGRDLYPLPAANLLWATPWSANDSQNGKLLESAAGVLHKGDVIWVAVAHRSNLRRFSDWTYDSKNEVAWLPAYQDKKPPAGPPALTLEQTPRAEGALWSYDHDSGYVVAMVGGRDYDRSVFNRITQGSRQPGSTYKPIYYSLALDKGYGYGSLLNDIPRAEVDPITGEVWVPTNLNNTIDYQVTLEYALVWSKNIPSVQLFKLVGGYDVEAWARRLGFTTKIIPDQALALGASYVRIDELTRAFSAFAKNGVPVDPVTIRRVRDREGRVLEDNSAVSDAMGAPGERLDRMVALAGRTVAPVIPPRTAWLTSQLLRRVVSRGHAPALRATGLPVAGKTGTSSRTQDVWFVGYTSRWMTTAWMGNDKVDRPLGYKDAAFMLAVPMCARYLWEATAGQPLVEVPWQRPAGVSATDRGGTLRTTMEEVEQDDKAEKAKAAAPVGKRPG